MPRLVHSLWFISAGRLATKSQWRSSDISGSAELTADIVHRNKKTANYQFREAKHILSTTNCKVKHGFTLLEIVLALFLILAIIVMLLSASGTLVSSRSSNLRSVAAKIQSREIETLRKMSFDSLPATGSFADADLSKLPQGSATQTLSSYQSSPDIKLVTIQVTWVENNATKSLSEDTLIYKNGLK